MRRGMPLLRCVSPDLSDTVEKLAALCHRKKSHHLREDDKQETDDKSGSS